MQGRPKLRASRSSVLGCVDRLNSLLWFGCCDGFRFAGEEEPVVTWTVQGGM